MSAVAVLDVGKTNVKLTAASREGELLETVTLANAPAAGPPYLHIDAARIEAWLFAELPALARRHGIGAIVATGHGSAGALVDDAGLVMPMIDYEAEVPAGGHRRLCRGGRSVPAARQPADAGRGAHGAPAPVARDGMAGEGRRARAGISAARNTGRTGCPAAARAN